MTIFRSPAGRLLVLALCASGGCDAFYMVRGKVRSCADHRPVKGAIVALRYPGEFGATQTQDQGEFQVSVNDPPGNAEAELIAASPGYQVARRAVHHSTEESQDVCLEPEAARPPSRSSLP